jgi:hypothetical protein
MVVLLSAENMYPDGNISGGRECDIVRHKERLCAIVESDQTSPEDKYEALIRLAALTSILTRAK